MNCICLCFDTTLRRLSQPRTVYKKIKCTSSRVCQTDDCGARLSVGIGMDVVVSSVELTQDRS